MVAIPLLRKGFTPGLPNRQGFLGVPLLQAVPTPVKFMRLSVLDLLLQALVIPVLTAFGKLKEYGGFLGFGMPLQLGNTLNNFQNSSCSFWMSLLVVGPRVMFNLAHDDPPVQGPATKKKTCHLFC